MDVERVGIIIPVFNAEKYINRCVKSVVNQSYQNIEIWLVDDCSVDNSYEICLDWGKKDIRIRVIKTQLNAGAGKARNLAIDKIFEEGKTSYLAFVDADDYVDKDYIRTMYTLCNNNHSDIAWIKNYTVPDSSEEIFYDNKEIDNIQVVTGKELLMRESDRIMYSMLWCKLFKLNLWNNVRIAENFRWYEDGASTFKVLYNADRIVISDLKKYYYCYSANSNIRSSVNEARLQCGIDTALVKIKFYQERNEKELQNIAYIGYLNDLLNSIEKNKELKGSKIFNKKIWNQYKKNYMKGVTCKYISFKQRVKYLIYRVFPGIRAYYIEIKCRLTGYR